MTQVILLICTCLTDITRVVHDKKNICTCLKQAIKSGLTFRQSEWLTFSRDLLRAEFKRQTVLVALLHRYMSAMANK